MAVEFVSSGSCTLTTGDGLSVGDCNFVVGMTAGVYILRVEVGVLGSGDHIGVIGAGFEASEVTSFHVEEFTDAPYLVDTSFPGFTKYYVDAGPFVVTDDDGDPVTQYSLYLQRLLGTGYVHDWRLFRVTT
jgi:hypothetical protein